VREHRSGAITWLQFESLAPLDGLVTHGVFAREGGVSPAPYATLNAGLSSGDDHTNVGENRRRIVETLPGQPPLVTVHPVHGITVVEIAAGTPVHEHVGALVAPGQADALITHQRGLGLFWAYADCAPVLLIDPQREAIGLVHAGWRGTSGAVVLAAVTAMGERYGTQPDDLHVCIGPAIGPCCYEVDAPVRAAFDAHPLAGPHAVFSTVMVRDDAGEERASLLLDVVASNVAQLRAIGVPEDQIEASGLCTSCRRDLFFSHRGEHGRTGRFAVVLALL
jgi:YfiH family protein